jgi:nucleoid-associated protein YgaU
MNYRFGLLAVMSSLVIVQSGCVTPYQQARMRQEASEREDLLMIREEIRRLQGQAEGLEMQIDSLRDESEFARREQERTASGQRVDLERRMGELERRMGDLESARKRDKDEILDNVAQTITKMMKTSTPTRSSSRPRTHTSGYGYEHTVQSGETLSAIAKAYGVTVQSILDGNDLTNPDQLRVGQVLFIPE